MKPAALMNGKLVDIGAPLISMEDRGYQFGDGVYEVVRVYRGKPFAMDAHLDRMKYSLGELRIPVPYSHDEMKKFSQMLLEESGAQEAGIYMQVTRGHAPRVHNFPDEVTPCLTMAVRGAKDNSALAETGAKGLLVPDERWLRCDIKSLNLLGSVLAKQKAKEAGCFEAIMIRDNLITEGSSSNFWVVKDGVLWTHPANNLILKGITRMILVDQIIPKLGLTMKEEAFAPEFAAKADEAFVCGTMSDVMPIVSLSGNPVGTGKVGEVTRKIQTEFNRIVDLECGPRS